MLLGRLQEELSTTLSIHTRPISSSVLDKTWCSQIIDKRVFKRVLGKSRYALHLSGLCVCDLDKDRCFDFNKSNVTSRCLSAGWPSHKTSFNWEYARHIDSLIFWNIHLASCPASTFHVKPWWRRLSEIGSNLCQTVSNTQTISLAYITYIYIRLAVVSRSGRSSLSSLLRRLINDRNHCFTTMQHPAIFLYYVYTWRSCRSLEIYLSSSADL